jgi:hypothetical protein
MLQDGCSLSHASWKVKKEADYRLIEFLISFDPHIDTLNGTSADLSERSNEE